MIADKFDIRFVSRDEVLAACEGHINPTNSVVATFNVAEWLRIRYAVCDPPGNLSSRNKIIIEYVDYLLRNFGDPSLLGLGRPYNSFVFQGDDRPTDATSLSWQIQKDYRNVCLLPDFYYVLARGYRNFFPEQVPDWSHRVAKLIWRGSTTGGFGITPSSLPSLARYKLCKAGLSLGDRADFGFMSVVQSASEEARKEIQRSLEAEGLFKNYVDLQEYANFKFFVQIDGNGNSWDLIKKLRLGSCMLLVDSDWLLWHNRILTPWVHYIPVRADLGDFFDIVEWCLTHDGKARDIANNGRNLAVTLNYDADMRDAFNAFCSHSIAFSQ